MFLPNIFLFCAALGGTIFLIQFVLTLLGLGHHHHVIGHHVSPHLGSQLASHIHHGTGHHAGVTHSATSAPLAHHTAVAHHGGILNRILPGHGKLGTHPAPTNPHAATVADAHHLSLAHQALRFLIHISFQSIIIMIAAFGLTGLAATSALLNPSVSIVLALIVGFVAVAFMAFIRRLVFKLEDEGNVSIHSAIGQAGTVYLSIPERHTGIGKVLVNVQGRTMEYPAVTTTAGLDAGTPVIVRALFGADTLEVQTVPTVPPLPPLTPLPN